VRLREHAGVGLRIVVVSTVSPIVAALVPRLAELGHGAVALLAARRDPDRPSPDAAALSDANAPAGIDLVYAHDRNAVERLLRAYEPDLMICWAFPWKLPGEALSVPALGSINQHPGLLPRYRGPVPFAWALRNGDSHLGLTWHRMDAELDTGPILAQTTVPIEDSDQTILDIGPRTIAAALDLLPGVLDQVLAGEPGEPQDDSRATWAGHFEDDEYARVDWSHSARAIHNQVRAWHLTFGMSGLIAPVAELDGRRVRLVRTSLTDPGDGVRQVETGDGPLWIVESEQVA
jgi:methionyl-tRNA formyltransferase